MSGGGGCSSQWKSWLRRSPVHTPGADGLIAGLIVNFCLSQARRGVEEGMGAVNGVAGGSDAALFARLVQVGGFKFLGWL